MKAINQIFLVLLLIGGVIAGQKENLKANAYSDPSKSSEHGLEQTSINITSNPSSNSKEYDAAVFEIKGVEAYVENKGWINVNSETQSVDMMELENGLEMTIANSLSIDASLISKITILFP